MTFFSATPGYGCSLVVSLWAGVESSTYEEGCDLTGGERKVLETFSSYYGTDFCTGSVGGEYIMLSSL